MEILAKEEKYLAEFGSSPDMKANHFISAGINSNEKETLMPSTKYDFFFQFFQYQLLIVFHMPPLMDVLPSN